MNMFATVLQVDSQSLLVRDEATGEEVLVFFPNASRFSVGDRVRITHNGQMTLSIPPQITATAIERLRPTTPAPSVPSQMRAIVLQRGRNFLIVWNIQDRRQIRVEYPYAHHFCVQQQVLIRYDTITMTNPPRVTATEITPVC